ncbi:acetyl-CoA synthetase-like protein [Aspergillus ibericus CBS 121593]|uniref:Acetyl-CoA synthetase-like protein n=1 Tax=Aspergillus ibericus CBS 121593 TaxID=1448316 RepID=A0A395GJ39_9EURO|nr:acetyl-CoA synthetase-like protein [Aspergillus ibericus CBS 121593]RAK95495.1 acetyl-CoA synthetase-like protein [Aspergillus ibericus CBS 121593]
MNTPLSRDVVTFALEAQAEYDPCEPLFIDAHEPSLSLNATQFRFLVHSLIAGFKANAMQPGDCVLVHMGNNIRLFSTRPSFLAIIDAGGVYMGSNPHSQGHELDHVVGLTQPKWIITESQAFPTVTTVADKHHLSLDHVLLLDDITLVDTIRFAHTQSPTPPHKTNNTNVLSLLSHGTSPPLLIPDSSSAASTPAALYSTSGTTGLPKAAVLSHRSLIAQHASITHSPSYNVTRLISLPIFHLFSSLWTHLFPLRYGHPLYILREFELPLFLSTVHRHKISETYLVPVMVHMLNQAPDFLEPKSMLSSLHYIGVAGAPINRASMTTFQDLLHPDACAGQVWGMTECGVVFQHRYPSQGRLGQGDLGSIGPVTPGWEAKLVSGASRVEVDEVSGQLYVRGAGLFTGYLGRSEVMIDGEGWFDTGDLAYVKNGEYFIVGRTKELIKVRGYQVCPAELEAVLLQDTRIRDVAVMGIRLPDGSEAPRAYVVRAAGAKLSSEEVYSFVRHRLAGYKALDGGVFFVDRIPRTVSGKIQRGKLASMNERRDALAGLLERFRVKGAVGGNARASVVV